MQALFAIPVVLGLLLLWVSRRDRRRQFIQNRLDALAAQSVADTPIPSLKRLRQKATSLMLPKRLLVLLDAAFESTGHSVRFIHLPFVALSAAVVVTIFAKFILNLHSGFTVTMATLTAALAAPLLLIYVAQARYQRHFLQIFPDALDLVGRSVRAGLPVNEALLVACQEIGDPVGKELRRAFDQVQIGLPMIEALEQAANRVRVADFRFMVVALALQEKTGGSLAETLTNLSTVIRARKALRLKARALSAEAKVSAFILAILPFVVGGFMYLMNRDLMGVLFVDPRGRFMVGLAFLSLVTGLITMAVMVKRAIR